MIRHFKRTLALALSAVMLFQIPALADYRGGRIATEAEMIAKEENLIRNTVTPPDSDHKNKATDSEADKIPLKGSPNGLNKGKKTLKRNIATASDSDYENKATDSEADKIPSEVVPVGLNKIARIMAAETIDVDDGISDSDMTDAASDSDGLWSYDPVGKIITVSGDVIITGTSAERRIAVEPDAEVQITIRDLNIDRRGYSAGAAIELGAGSDLTLIIEGDNFLAASGNCAGLQAPEGTRLLIDAADDNQKLECLSGYRSAGIGGGDEQNGGLIHIAGGEIIASGRSSAIGGGASMWGTNFKADIIISGGRITAIGLIGSTVGIGGLRPGGSVLISGGIIDIQVNGGSIDPNRAICVPDGEIVITGGNITATTGMIGTPVNGDGTSVYLATLPSQTDVTSLSIDGNPYYTTGNYADSSFLNLYLTGENHVVDVETSDALSKRYLLTWLDSTSEPYFDVAEDTSGLLPVDTQVSLELTPERLIYGTGETELQIKATIDRNISANARAMDFVSLYFDEASEPFSIVPIYGNQAETVLDLVGKTPGVHTIEAEYSGGYGQNPGRTSKTFVIAEPFSMSTSVIYEEQHIYTGESITPEVTVIHNQTLLVPDQDYTCEYRQNIDAGTAAIIIEGINCYDGIINRTFSINPAYAQSISDTIGDVQLTAYDTRFTASSPEVIALAALPDTISVLTNSGVTAVLPIEWATQTPFHAKGAIYQVTGTVRGNDNIETNDITANVIIQVTPLIAAKPELNAISVKAGSLIAATAAELGSDILPVTGQLSQYSEIVKYRIDWNGGQTLDLTKAGISQTFTGIMDYVIIPEWMTLPSDLNVNRTVIVKEKDRDETNSSSGDSEGSASGWVRDSMGWQYLKPNGKRASAEWKQLEGVWYYFDNTGYMAEGWRFLNEKWFWLIPGTGRMASNEWAWYQDNWYYLGTDGAMITGWQEYRGSFYYLSEENDRYFGHMFQNQMTPNGYWVDSDGKRVQ